MLALTRLHDWDRRLARAVDQHMTMLGQWGVCDCMLAAGDAVLAVSGVDPMADIRGTYTSAAGAARVLRRRGFDDVEQALASILPPVGVLLAQRGDVGVVSRDGVLSAGYVCDRGVAVKIEGLGSAFLPQTELKSAFKVG